MSRLTAAARRALPDSAFALPGRRYPIPDESHARDALALAAMHATPQEQSRVRAAVRRRFPQIAQRLSSKAPSA